MGKIRTRVLGYEEIEKEQKEEQKKRSAEKKAKEGKGTDETEVAGQAKSPEGEKPKKAKKGKKSKNVNSNVKGKKYKKSLDKVDKKKFYTLPEAVELLKKIKFTSFDESVELHLNVDETGLKGEIELPHSTGKTVRVKIVDDALLESIEKGVIEFDILIAHPSFMPKLAKFARTLGPKGLMPNPKSGTVSPKPEEVAKKFEKGTLRWKTEAKFPLIHQMVGKISAEDKALAENVVAFMKSVGNKHIKQAVIKTTMSPGLKLVLEAD